MPKRNANLKVTTINVQIMHHLIVDKLVKYGIYTSNSDAIRQYVRIGIKKDMEELTELTQGKINKEKLINSIQKELLEEFDF